MAAAAPARPERSATASRAPSRVQHRAARPPEGGRPPHPRSAEEGAQEVRTKGRPRALPVQQAVRRKRGRSHTERAAGGRRPLRAPDPALEPEDEALHLRQAQRHLHHRPAEDGGLFREAAEFVHELAGARQADSVRRHQAPGRRTR